MADEMNPDGDRLLDLAFAAGIEIIVRGDESRTQLARRVVEEREPISARAVRLLEGFMRDHGTFELSSVEVFPLATSKEGDFVFRYSFIADRDEHEYGYTYFEVYFLCHEPPQEPYWPFKFTVGFH